MNEAWVVGPLLIQAKWVFYLASIAISYAGLQIALKKKALDARMLDQIWNGFFVFLIVWKASYALFYPASALKNPISALYFTGGDKGAALGVISAALYLLWKSNRGPFSFQQCMKWALFAVFAAVGSYRLLSWFVYFSDEAILLFAGLIHFAIIVHLLKNRNWVVCLLWFSLAEFAFSYMENKSGLNLSFYFVLAVICFFHLAFQGGKSFFSKLKKVIPLFLLGSLILWAGYDAARSLSLKEAGEGAVGLSQGDAAPGFSLVSLQGKPMNLSDFRGQRVILNFWATWCPPCRAEMPDMQTYYDEFQEADNVVIVAVNATATEQHPDVVHSFVKDIGVTFPILLDEQSEVKKMYGVAAYPTTYFIDEKGVIQFKVVGPMSREAIRKQVKQMH